MNSLPSLKRSTLGRWLVITAVIAALPLSAIAQLSYRMAIKSVQIVNWSAPKITEITAGYLVKVRVEGEWIEGNISGADVTILVDDQIVLSERQNFRDNLGTFSMNFAKDFALPKNLVAGEHTLTVKCGGGKLQCDPHRIQFHVASSFAPTPPNSPPPAPTLSRDELLALYEQRARDASTRVAQAYCRVLGVAFNPSELKDNSGSIGAEGIQFSYQIKGGKRLLDEVFIVVNHSTNTPALVRLRGADAEIYNPATGLEQKWTALRRTPDQPQFLYWEAKYKGMSLPPDAPPQPPDYEVNLGSVHVSGSGTWIESTAFGPSRSAAGSVASSPFHSIHISSTPDLPAEELERIRDKYYPVPPGIPYAERKIIDEKFDAEVKQARQDGGRQIVLLLGDIGRAFCPLLEGKSSDQTALQRLAAWTPPDSKPPAPPVPDLSSISIPGVRTSKSTPPSATTPAYATPQAMLRQLGEQSADRASAIVEQAIPSADGLTSTETSILAEAALTGEDPVVLLAEIAEEETALSATASGDDLRIADVQYTPNHPNPGDDIEVTVTVRNTATNGGTAYFDLSLDDYHNGNRPVSILKRRSLPPGQSANYSLHFPAPRDYTFGGYATVDPMVFSGSELPFQVVNIKINWDGSTMTDEEIVDELRDRNPCPAAFPLTADRLSRFVALYRANRLEALATLERESIGADREIQQADYLARLRDPAYQQQLQDDLDAAANTKQLAAYSSLRKLAFEWGYIHHLDLVAILDDTVFIDNQAKVHGDVALARRLIFRAMEEKQANPGAVQSLLLADPNDKSGHTQTYREAEPIMTPALSALGLADLGNATSTAIATRCIEDIQTAYNQLRKISRDSGTSVLTFQLERDQMRRVLASARERLGRVDSPIVRDTISKATAQLDKLDDVAAQATRFQQRVKTVMGTKRAAETVGNTLSNIGEIWSVYEVSEKVLARTNGGEDFVVAVGKECGNWGAKKLIFACPVLAAADTAMSATGHLFKKLGPEYWEAKGIDPTQYNASTLVDIGTGVTFAGIEDMSRIYGKRYDREAPLDAEERAVLEARLVAFEERLNSTTDPVLRQRLLTARTNVRQTLRERR